MVAMVEQKLESIEWQVAKTLGWELTDYQEDGEKGFVYLTPPGIEDDSEWSDQQLRWFENNGGAPEFLSNAEDFDILTQAINNQNLVLQVCGSAEVRTYNLLEDNVIVASIVSKGSFNICVCRLWLKLKG